MVELFYGRCLWPGLLRARCRSVAFGEPNPSYPYRGFIRIVYKCLSRLKGRSVLLTDRLKNRTCEARKTATAQREGPNKNYHKEFNLSDAFGPGYSGLAAARFLLRKEPSPAYPYRGFIRIVYKCLSRLVPLWVLGIPRALFAYSFFWAMPSARAALVLFILKIG